MSGRIRGAWLLLDAGLRLRIAIRLLLRFPLRLLTGARLVLADCRRSLGCTVRLLLAVSALSLGL
jgi:hypothetical protein